MKRAMALILCLILALSAAGGLAEGEAMTFKDLSGLTWSFSSGAGAWETSLRIAPDGTFVGEYHDSEMGDAADAYPNGTVYYSSFVGKLTIGEAIDEYSWRVSVDFLTPDQVADEETIGTEEGVRYVAAEPYGLKEGAAMTLYRPDTPMEQLTDELRLWAHVYDTEDAPDALEHWLLASDDGESGFVGYDFDAVTMANPWQTLTADELAQAAGVTFGVPEGAENVEYRWLKDENLAEMQFTMESGDEYCARVQPTAEPTDISGMYYGWENVENVNVGYCEGTIGQYQTGSNEYVELIQWYDAAPGLMYALSVYTTDLDGLDLKAVAEQVFVPVQGDA